MDTWFETRLVGPNTWAIDDHGQDTIYLVIGSERALLIDTGWGVGDLPSHVRSLTDRPITVVNTHSHPDHACGDYQFPEVHVGEADVRSIEQMYAANSVASLRERALPGLAPGFDASAWCDRLPRLVPVSEGHVFDLGDRRLQVIETGGHSPGCICLLDAKHRQLFSGDSILVGPIWMQLDHSLPLRQFVGNLKHLREFADRFDVLLPAHRTTPLDKRALDDLIVGCEDVLAGRIVGTPERTFAGDGLRRDFGPTGVGLLYRPENLE